MGSLHLKKSFEVVHKVLNEILFFNVTSTQLLRSTYNYDINTQLRYGWIILAVLEDPGTRISLSVIEFTAVETKGNLGSSRALAPQFQISRQFDILCMVGSISM